jgi:hypothetical protein
MSAETGHQPNRAYFDQAGNLHLNGASVFDANEVDQKNALAAPVAGVAAGYKVARGQATTSSASDTVVTGLTTVVSVVATLDSDPVAGCQRATASIGDQAGTPAAGSILIKTWKTDTTAGNVDLAATTFTKKVNWFAIGT